MQLLLNGRPTLCGLLMFILSVNVLQLILVPAVYMFHFDEDFEVPDYNIGEEEEKDEEQEWRNIPNSSPVKSLGHEQLHSGATTTAFAGPSIASQHLSNIFGDVRGSSGEVEELESGDGVEYNSDSQRAREWSKKKENGEERNFYDDYFVDYRKLMQPSEEETVRFVEQPQSAYIVRSKPAQLTCRALNARRLRFRCNNKWLDESRHLLVGGVDGASRQPFLQASVQISRQELDARLADLGEFACQCYASGGSSSQPPQTSSSSTAASLFDAENIANAPSASSSPALRSDTARIRLAYIRKHFYQTPAAERVAEGRTVQLPCVPPDADPKPEITWRKDGQEINNGAQVAGDNGVEPMSMDSNLILASDGSLIISATRLSDSGNYSCEASNLANRRVADPAQILVYVDGQWSPWSPWQGTCPTLHHPHHSQSQQSNTFDCALLKQQLGMSRGQSQSSTQRLLPQQRRTRVCNNPAPLNEGAYCPGEEEEFRLCKHNCLIDGEWAKWSDWSECNPQCQRVRSRECTAPAPANGGTYCQGKDVSYRNCTQLEPDDLFLPPHCLDPPPAPLGHPTHTSSQRVLDGSPTTHLQPQQLYILASMGCVAFLLVIIAGLIAALLCRQRRGRKGSKNLGISPTGSGGIFLDEKGEKLYFPMAVEKDELQHVRTVLLSQQQQRALLGDYINCVGSPGGKPILTRASTPNAKFYTMTTNNNNGGSLIHHTGSTGAGGLNSTHTIRSAKSYTNSSGYAGNRRMAGSRAALITEYSSSNASSTNGGSASGKMVVLGRGAIGGGPFSPEEEGNYATLYDYVATSNDSMANAISSEGLASANSSEKFHPPSSLQTCTAELDDEDEEMEEFSGEQGVLIDGCYSNSTSNEPINRMLENGQSQLNDPNAATIVAAQVDSESTRIELKRSGVALTIGEGTFLEEQTVFLAVSDNYIDRPALRENETWLSSVVVCGTCEEGDAPTCSQKPQSPDAENKTSLRRPVVLSFEHCASLFPKDNWQFVVYQQQLDNTESSQSNPPWEVVCRLGEENINTPIYVQLERQRCQLMTDHFGRFLMAGRPRRPNVAAHKRVHLAAYCSMVRGSQEKESFGHDVSSIRVYCVPEMFMAVENVRQQEDEKQGILLAEAEGFLMRQTGSLCCCLEDISEGFVLEQGSSQYLEIPDSHHQWCAQNGLHFSLSMKPVGSTVKKRMQNGDEEEDEGQPLLSGRIVIYQKGNPSERQILAFKVNRAQMVKAAGRRRRSSSSSFPYPSLSQTNLAPNIVSLPGHNSGEMTRLEEDNQHLSIQFQLSSGVKRALANLLDCNPSRPNGINKNNWASLAKKLGFDRYIQYFATHPGCSPTSLVLDLWEACVGDSERALLDLLQTLRVMGRADAVAVLEKYLAGGYAHDDQSALPPPPPSNSVDSSAANSHHALKTLFQ